MSKRKRFLIISLLTAAGFIGIQLTEERFKFIGIGLLGLLTLILFVWSLKEGLSFNWTLLSLILPVLFTFGVGLFWFLLPVSIIARIPVLLFFGLGIYALSLTSNIYTVSAIRSIALLRAARGVGFVLTLITSFLLFDAILSLKWDIYFQAELVFLISFPVYLQGFWTVGLNEKVGWELFSITLISSLIMFEVAISLYFWPVTVVVGSLFLTGVEYVLLGLGQAKIEGRLFNQTVKEYLIVGLMVFLGMFFATRWGG